MELNETPKRTSRNFNINNIRLDDSILPDNISSFDNIKHKKKKNIEINNIIKDFIPTYGLGNDLTNYIKSNSNKNININITNSINEDAQIIFEFDENNKELLENIEIVAQKGVKATIILKYTNKKDIKYFHAGLLHLIAEENSNIDIIIVNLLNNLSYNLFSIENKLSKSAKVNYYIVDFGGKQSVTNYYTNLLGDYSENTVNTIYLGNNEQIFDLNYITELRGMKTRIKMDVQGALNDNSKKHFKGSIDFKKGSKKAIGDETESCMLLSDEAKSISLPMLLCSEEDVEGNHSCSAGKIDSKELFYIQSRGFELKEAMKLMVIAKFNKILENITNEDLKQEILNQIDTRIN